MPDVQQLDTLTLSRQTLEGNLDTGKARELDLKSQTLSRPCTALLVPDGLRFQPKRTDLIQQTPAMLCPISFRDVRPTVPSPRAIGLGLRDSFEDEVSVSPSGPVRHIAVVFLRYVPLSLSLSAMVLRSVSVFRMSVSLSRGRSWIRAYFMASLAARVTSA